MLVKRLKDRAANERLRQFKERTGLSFAKLGFMFGVQPEEVTAWHRNACHMPEDCQRTLARFESENIDRLEKAHPKAALLFIPCVGCGHFICYGCDSMFYEDENLCVECRATITPEEEAELAREQAESEGRIEAMEL